MNSRDTHARSRPSGLNPSIRRSDGVAQRIDALVSRPHRRIVGCPPLAPNGLARQFRPGPVLKVDRKPRAPAIMTRLIRLVGPESIATVTNLAPALPLMTETNSELQGLLPQ